MQSISLVSVLSITSAYLRCLRVFLPSVLTGRVSPRQSKYSCVTCVAQTLQEDPSCQLCNVLARYIQQTPLSELEAELRARFLPDTTTLKQVQSAH